MYMELRNSPKSGPKERTPHPERDPNREGLEILERPSPRAENKDQTTIETKRNQCVVAHSYGSDRSDFNEPSHSLSYSTRNGFCCKIPRFLNFFHKTILNTKGKIIKNTQFRRAKKEASWGTPKALQKPPISLEIYRKNPHS